MEAKDVDKIQENSKVFQEREKAIAKQWLNFSRTDAYADLMQYGHTTSDMLSTYAKEMVMPSPVGEGEQIIIDGEKSLSLLQNARGCDIILSYIEEYTSQGANK